MRLKRFTLWYSSYVSCLVNSLPNDNFSDWSKLKAFADDNLHVAQMMIYVFDCVESIAGNGKKVLVSSIPTMFSKVVFLSFVKSQDFVVKS